MNVLFKRGLSAGLPTSGAIEGAFYLTTDTNRLYIGKNLAAEGQAPNIVPVELNQSITIKNNLAEAQAFTDDLNPEAKKHGQFFYLAQENILAVYKDNQWVQINPDTNTNDNTKVVAAGTQDMVDNASTNAGNTRFVYDGVTNGVAHYRLIVEQTTSHLGGAATDESSVIAKLDLDLTTLNSSAVAVGSSAVASNATTVNTSGAGASGNGFTITGGTNVTLSGSANALTISATDTTYDLSSSAHTGNNNAADIVLTPAGGSEDTITITGDAKVNVSGSTVDTIALSHATSGVTADTYGTNSTLTAGGTLVVPSFTVDNTGHITSATSNSLTLPNDTKVTAVAADNTGKITITNSDGSSPESGVDLYYNIDKVAADGTTTTTKVVNQGNLGAFYTKTAIDGLLQGLNAMTYKGTAFGTGATVATLPTTGVHAGDSYLASADSSPYKRGDLIIATGTEEADGTIASPTWTVVPAGSDTDTTYTFSVDGTSLIYEASSSAGTESTYATIDGGNELTATGSGSTITIDHDKVLGNGAGTTKGLSADAQLTFGGTGFKVPVITVNDYGHITAIDEHTITLPTSQQSISALSSDGAAIVLENSNVAAGTVTLQGDGSHITVGAGTGANTIKVTHAGPGNSGTTVGTGTPKASADTTLNYGDKFVVPTVSYDSLGHVYTSSEVTYQIPASDNTTYTLSANTPSGLSAQTTGIELVLDASNGADSSVSITSESLTISHTAQANTINIEWGTF